VISTLKDQRSGLERQVNCRVDDITTISAKLLSCNEESCIVALQFWSNDTPEKPAFQDIKVHMPSSWTPKMYLAAVFTSLCYKKDICIFETVSPLNKGAEIITINDLCTSYFPIGEHSVKSMIRFGIIRVVGGYD